MVSWFCEVGGMMRAEAMMPVSVELVAVQQKAPGRLGRARAHSRRWRDLGCGGRAARRTRTSRSASSQANTSSTARTTMLRKGLRHTGPSPAAAAAWRAISGRTAAFSA